MDSQVGEAINSCMAYCRSKVGVVNSHFSHLSCQIISATLHNFTMECPQTLSPCVRVWPARLHVPLGAPGSATYAQYTLLSLFMMKRMFLKPLRVVVLSQCTHTDLCFTYYQQTWCVYHVIASRYKEMQRCWSPRASKRPLMEDLQQRLKSSILTNTYPH